MVGVIEDLWYGNIDPQVQRVEGNKEIKNLLNLMGKNRDELSATLGEGQISKTFTWSNGRGVSRRKSLVQTGY